MTLTAGNRIKDEIISETHNPIMTVEVAQAFFTDYGDDTEGLFEELYKNIAARGPAELANDNYLDALQLTALMIRKTKKSFRMLTGCTAEAFIGHLRKYFAEMIERLHDASGFARVIVLDAQQSAHSYFEALTAKYPDTLRVEHATTVADAKLSHFIVADDMVRIEKPHPHLTPNMAASVIQARVLFSNRGAASVYEAEFDRLLDLLKPACVTR